MFIERRATGLYISPGQLVSKSDSLHHILTPLLAWELQFNRVKINDSLLLNCLAYRDLFPPIIIVREHVKALWRACWWQEDLHAKFCRQVQCRAKAENQTCPGEQVISQVACMASHPPVTVLVVSLCQEERQKKNRSKLKEQTFTGMTLKSWFGPLCPIDTYFQLSCSFILWKHLEIFNSDLAHAEGTGQGLCTNPAFAPGSSQPKWKEGKIRGEMV